MLEYTATNGTAVGVIKRIRDIFGCGLYEAKLIFIRINSVMADQEHYYLRGIELKHFPVILVDYSIDGLSFGNLEINVSDIAGTKSPLERLQNAL